MSRFFNPPLLKFFQFWCLIFVYAVTIESTGSLPPEVLFTEAVKILEEKCEAVIHELSFWWLVLYLQFFKVIKLIYLFYLAMFLKKYYVLELVNIMFRDGSFVHTMCSYSYDHIIIHWLWYLVRIYLTLLCRDSMKFLDFSHLWNMFSCVSKSYLSH